MRLWQCISALFFAVALLVVIDHFGWALIEWRRLSSLEMEDLRVAAINAGIPFSVVFFSTILVWLAEAFLPPPSPLSWLLLGKEFCIASLGLGLVGVIAFTWGSVPDVRTPGFLFSAALGYLGLVLVAEVERPYRLDPATDEITIEMVVGSIAIGWFMLAFASAALEIFKLV